MTFLIKNVNKDEGSATIGGTGGFRILTVTSIWMKTLVKIVG